VNNYNKYYRQKVERSSVRNYNPLVYQVKSGYANFSAGRIKWLNPSQKYYTQTLWEGQAKLCTKFDISLSAGFESVVNTMSHILGVT